jgi:hypothetical protein
MIWQFLWDKRYYELMVAHLYQVYEDNSTYRGEGKKIARSVIRSKYSILPEETTNRTAYRAEVARRVKDLIEDSKFLHDGKDAHVRGAFSSFHLR